jgi:hypothetical protein
VETIQLASDAAETRGPKRKNKSSSTGITTIHGCWFTTPKPADSVSTMPVARGSDPRAEVDSLTDRFYQNSGLLR